MSTSIINWVYWVGKTITCASLALDMEGMYALPF